MSNAWDHLGGGVLVVVPPAVPHRRVDGWAGEESEGRPVPCSTCRAALAREPGTGSGGAAGAPTARRRGGRDDDGRTDDGDDGAVGRSGSGRGRGRAR